MPRYQKRLLYDQIINLPDADSKIVIQEDIKTLTSDYLIHHIDFMFRLRDKATWLQESVGIDVFYDYILPYNRQHQRLEQADYEEMERRRKSLQHMYLAMVLNITILWINTRMPISSILW